MGWGVRGDSGGSVVNTHQNRICQIAAFSQLLDWHQVSRPIRTIMYIWLTEPRQISKPLAPDVAQNNTDYSSK